MSVFYGVRLTDEIDARIKETGKGKSEVITAALEMYFGGKVEAEKPEKMIIEKPKKKPARDPDEVEKPRAIESEPAEKPKETEPAKSGRLEPCPRCEGPTVPWGPGRRCQNCTQNWPM